MRNMPKHCLMVLFILASGIVDPAVAGEPFVVVVRDGATGLGIPLVELRTVHEVRLMSDNAGVVAVSEPELMGEEVFFHVSSHGYEVAADGFGYRGVRLQVEAGGKAEVKVKRVQIAERIGRLTGAGRFDHSVRAGLVGEELGGLGNGKVLGCDSVHTAIYGGEVFWLWGDTNRVGYPLGNFHTSCATSALPRDGDAVGRGEIEYRYFTREDGFVKEAARLEGDGPTWLSGLAVLLDEEGEEQLVAHFAKIRPPLEVYRRGLCRWDRGKEEFVEVLELKDDLGRYPDGHTFLQEIDGESWLVFADPLPSLRVPASYEAWTDPSRYVEIDTVEKFREVASGRRVKPHRGSLAWNGHREAWLMIFTEQGGDSSYLGEVWYAEAGTPDGPWEGCVKVVTHDRYSLYNPCQHPYLSGDGRHLLFEGTYTTMFSGRAEATPKYEYNQLLFRLDLDDERLEGARVRGRQ
jgi:hypothetical protein